jgi:hypothetical protein
MRAARRIGAVVAALGFLVVQTPAWAADPSPLVGTWRWNPSLSRLPAGEAAPAALTAVISRADPLHVAWAITTTGPKGDTAMRSFDVPANGEAYPISSDTRASIQLTARGLNAVFRGPAGEVDTLSCMVGGAGTRMTCDGEVQGQDKKTSRYVDVYDRA